YLRRCKKSDEAFFRGHESADALADINAHTTAIAVKTLSAVDDSIASFLTTHLQIENSGTARVAESGLFLSSIILDWEQGLASRSLLKGVRRVANWPAPHNALEQALLLRCLLRLRLQSAWTAAADLRKMQQPDGSWSRHVALPVVSVVPAKQ